MPYRDPKPEESRTPEFLAIWGTIRGWDIDMRMIRDPRVRSANHNHVMAILDGLKEAGCIFPRLVSTEEEPYRFPDFAKEAPERRELARKKVRLIVDREGESLTFECDPEQISQVLCQVQAESTCKRMTKEEKVKIMEWFCGRAGDNLTNVVYRELLPELENLLNRMVKTEA